MAASLESFFAETERAERPLLESVADLIDLEYTPRKDRSARTRLKLSGIPEAKRIEDFDLSWLKGGLSERKFEELSSLAFIARKENVIFLGPSGVGKSHLLQAIGAKACRSGYSAYYLSTTEAIERLGKARDGGRLRRKLAWMQKPHVLLLDEVGYENLIPEQATLFFQLVASRYERGSIVMTTNRPFSKWGEIMADDAVATATLDRLLHHAHIVSLKGDSYRMKDRMKLGVVDLG